MSIVGRYYDDKARAYDAEEHLLYFKVYDLVTWKYTKPYLPEETTAKVLDAAGGTGKWSVRIAREGPLVVLVDLSNGMLEVARQKINESGLSSRIEVHQGDITDLDFDDETFDMVFCEHALCFVENMKSALRELVRVLKKGSPIVISAQNRYPLSLSVLKDDFGAATQILLGHERFLMRGAIPVHTLFPEEFRSLLKGSGIKITKVVGKGIILTPLVLPMEKFWTDNYSQEFLDKLINVELFLCERPDVIPLAGHMQALGHKS
jgi:demethylmenaquinone methyltransferase/2-methoxy-6-polyprenyl-1,4-benzoquinol methylase